MTHSSEHNHSGCWDENGLLEGNKLTNKQETKIQERKKKGTREPTIAKSNQRLVLLRAMITVGKVVEIGIHIY